MGGTPPVAAHLWPLARASIGLQSYAGFGGHEQVATFLVARTVSDA
jgi:hypothetical protein